MEDQNLNNSLQIALVPQSFLDGLMKEVEEVKNLLRQKSEEEISNQWIESSKARELLGVSIKTLQTYRDERRIPFSQFGRKIYFKRIDLESFMQANYISARK
ncbi:excisionase [Elizabethkingia anophelis]|nr:helix-turn-helix domain-containing protein [Elizabethkingia anophelis]MCT3874386.1 helix-turn-helix domain-containing protein [Elizabethkingia anophelis]MDV3846520.1 excisionase [Elizabethkingia anophelis]